MQNAMKKIQAENVYDQLKMRIFNQQLMPGEKINIERLSKELLVSTIPLRESLSRLHSERLVTFESFKGYRVTPIIDAKTKNDLFKVRLLIEINAVESIIHNQYLEVAEKLEVLNHKMIETRVDIVTFDYLEFNLIDQQFHSILVEAADNAFLLDAYKGIHCHLHLARLYMSRGEVDKPEAMDEHTEIIAAIRTGDLTRAQQAVRSHIINAKTRLS